MTARLRLAALLCAATGLGAGAPAAEAQVCGGTFLWEGEWSLRAGVGRASYRFRGEVEATDFAVEARALPLPGLGIVAGYTYRDMDGSALSVHVLRGGADRRIPTPPLPLDLCARAQLGIAYASDAASGTDYANLAVPLGVSAGTAYRPGGGLVLTPYVAPALVLSWLSGRVLDVEVEETDLAAGLELGVGARLRRWVGGVGLWLSSLDPEVGTAAYPRQAIRFELGVVF